MKIPFDRVVTFILPYVNVVAGAVAAWLITNVHFLGLVSNVSSLTEAISALVVFGVVTGAAELGRNGWLKGRHIELAGVAEEDVLATKAKLQVAVQNAWDPNDTSDEDSDVPVEGLESRENHSDLGDGDRHGQGLS